MAIDGIIMHALVHECNNLIGGRLNKIYQPNDTDVILHIRVGGITKRLLLSAHPVYARFHLTEKTYENPLDPPMFCMLLRKHCGGGIIKDIHQVDLERILHLDIEVSDELGNRAIRRLVVEIMGRHSNIILLDPSENRIFDGIRRVTPAMSQHRQIFPGATYIEPPDHGKHDPLTVNETTFFQLLDFNRGRMDQQIVDQFTGIGPLLAKEIVHRAGLGSREAYWRAFKDIMEKVKAHRYEPTIAYAHGRERLSAFRLTHIQGESRTFARMHDGTAHFFERKAERDTVLSRVHDLMRFVQNSLKKNERKLNKLKRELHNTEQADQYRLYGELLTAYMHKVRSGDTQVEVVNYYDPTGQTVRISLDPALTPSDNAQKYFKKYQKAKASRSHLEEQIKQTKEECTYLSLILQQLENADMEDMDDIREELEQEGYLRKRQSKKDSRRKNTKKQTFTVFTSSEGIPIYVGRNNRQNEYLTNRLANRTDTWLHAKDIPGSHVIIRSPSFGEATLLEAAQIAAYFSKGRQSSQVPVDYTLVKHVKKPKGAKPGFVTYDHPKTLYVTPDESLIQKLPVKRT